MQKPFSATISLCLRAAYDTTNSISTKKLLLRLNYRKKQCNIVYRIRIALYGARQSGFCNFLRNHGIRTRRFRFKSDS